MAGIPQASRKQLVAGHTAGAKAVGIQVGSNSWESCAKDMQTLFLHLIT